MVLHHYFQNHCQDLHIRMNGAVCSSSKTLGVLSLCGILCNSCRHNPRDQVKFLDGTSHREILHPICTFWDADFVGPNSLKTNEFLFLTFLLRIE